MFFKMAYIPLIAVVSVAVTANSLQAQAKYSKTFYADEEETRPIATVEWDGPMSPLSITNHTADWDEFMEGYHLHLWYSFAARSNSPTWNGPERTLFNIPPDGRKHYTPIITLGNNYVAFSLFEFVENGDDDGLYDGSESGTWHRVGTIHPLAAPYVWAFPNPGS